MLTVIPQLSRRYNYIIDPVIRNDLAIKLTDAVLIFDEGHNVLDAAMEAMTLKIDLEQLKSIVQEVCMRVCQFAIFLFCFREQYRFLFLLGMLLYLWYGNLVL